MVVHHGGHAVEAVAVELELVDPPARVGQQEAQRLPAACREHTPLCEGGVRVTGERLHCSKCLDASSCTRASCTVSGGVRGKEGGEVLRRGVALHQDLDATLPVKCLGKVRGAEVTPPVAGAPCRGGSTAGSSRQTLQLASERHAQAS